MFEYSNIRIPFEYSNTISEFEYSHFYLSPRCTSSKFSNEELLTCIERWLTKGLRDGSLQNQFLPGRFLRDISLKISNGTVHSKVVGRFAPKQIYGSIHPFS